MQIGAPNAEDKVTTNNLNYYSNCFMQSSPSPSLIVPVPREKSGVNVDFVLAQTFA